jgi:hypothetical protein
MIGACPGEELPPWPPATHAERPTGSQKGYVTEAQALRGLSRRDRLHDVARAVVRNNPPRDGNVPLSRTITCGGPHGVSHFSGRRDHTEREIACLQGFPVSHQFEGTKTEVKKQIGNAFPSCVAKAFYEHLKAWLQSVDGVHHREQAAPAQVEAHRSPAAAPASASASAPRPPRRDVSNRQQNSVNGDLNEDETLAFALQESRAESPAVVLCSIEEDPEHSPVLTVRPLLERLSLAPLDPINDQFLSPERLRSHTLGRSASPCPSRSPTLSHRAKSGSQKRTLDSMHNGETDEVMKKESPPKREKVDARRNCKQDIVDDKIPTKLPRYRGLPRPYNVDNREDSWTF